MFGSVVSVLIVFEIFITTKCSNITLTFKGQMSDVWKPECLDKWPYVRYIDNHASSF